LYEILKTIRNKNIENKNYFFKNILNIFFCVDEKSISKQKKEEECHRRDMAPPPL